MNNFATTNELIKRWRPLTADEITMAEVLLTDVSNALRVYAFDRGLDIDAMVTAQTGDEQHIIDMKASRAGLATAVVCDIVKREMTSNTDSPAMSQISQAAGGYSVSGTYLSPGGGLFIKNSELKLLGLAKQKVKMVGAYGDD